LTPGGARERDSGAREFRILALSGGGYLGLYSAAVLAALEQHIGEPIGRRFELIAGTSVGGVIAAAVAFELPLTGIVDYFRRHGADVFSPRAKPSGTVGRLIDLSRAVLGPKYASSGLRNALAAQLGSAKLGQALHPLLLPAVNVTKSLTKVFKSPHAKASRGDENVPVLDAVMAACAAPAYFASVSIGDSLYADGGLFAVAPDQVALHEAEHFMGIDLAQVRMLSIGTATVGYQPAEGVTADAGAVGWLSDGRLIMTLIAVGQQHVQAMMEDRLGDRYLRLDAEWPAQSGLGIDVATPQAADILLELAAGTVRDLDGARLSGFL
jgi:patatin-like phospholipase/acyl hydrolase